MINCMHRYLRRERYTHTEGGKERKREREREEESHRNVNRDHPNKKVQIEGS